MKKLKFYIEKFEKLETEEKDTNPQHEKIKVEKNRINGSCDMEISSSNSLFV
jgi:uncharacterized protein (UPF0335 family)